MEKNKGGEPLFGLFSRPERGAKGLPAWLWCAGWLSRGGCGFVLVVQVGVGLWVSPFFPAPLVSRSPGGGRAALHSLAPGPWKNSKPTCLLAQGREALLTPLPHVTFPTVSSGGGRLPWLHHQPPVCRHTTFVTHLGAQEFWPFVTKVTFLTLWVPIFHPG